MRYALIIVSILVTACAGKADPTCSEYASPYMARYPDGSFAKSTVALCVDGNYKVSPLGAGRDSFRTAMPTVHWYDSDSDSFVESSFDSVSH